MSKVTHEVFEVGDSVVCDACGKDFTESDRTGGFLFETKAYCPECASRSIDRIRAYNEERFIRERCPHDLSFADWVRKMRYRTGNDKIVITTRE